MNIQGEEATNPATLQINSITSAHEKALLESVGLTVWDIGGHVALCCAKVLRQYAGCLVTSDRVDNILKPAIYWDSKLIEAARAAVSLEAMTRLLRGLLAEGITLRPWRLILETILEGSGLHHLSETELAAFLRANMQAIIGNKYARGTDTLVAYLLGTALEDKLNEADDEQEEVISAIRNELSYLPRTAQLPVILTNAQLRPKLTQVVQHDFPLLSVVAHEDLPPTLNVQPIARINLD
jgi:type III secretion protein V